MGMSVCSMCHPVFWVSDSSPSYLVFKEDKPGSWDIPESCWLRCSASARARCWTANSAENSRERESREAASGGGGDLSDPPGRASASPRRCGNGSFE
ncbi:F-Box Only Protein 11 [Manis pentadactyla]|nr:F-Box Only Protein 11 [Manis pentadactyla]